VENLPLSPTNVHLNNNIRLKSRTVMRMKHSAGTHGFFSPKSAGGRLLSDAYGGFRP